MPTNALVGEISTQSQSAMFKTFVARMAELMENLKATAEETAGYINSMRTAMTTEQIKPETLFRMLNGTTALLIKLKENGQALPDNDDPTILFISEMLEKQIFGYFPGELRGAPISKLMPERFQEIHKTHIALFRDHPKDRPMGKGNDILKGVTRDGEEFDIEVLFSVFGPEDGSGDLYVVANINPCKIIVSDSGIHE